MTEQPSPLESEDSDNEPLALIVEDKNRLNSNGAHDSTLELKTQPLFSKIYEKKKLWRKTEVIHDKIEVEQEKPFVENDYAVTNGGGYANMFISYILPPIQHDEPLMDMWMDAKSINQTGPMSCILCYECFLNKNKLIMHYVLNHNKPFCGTCRYMLNDKESWDKHWQCHLPLHCSHCPDKFKDEISLRTHFVSFHHLAHCRMCSLMLPVGELYKKHLTTKHSVTVNHEEEMEEVWSVLYPESWSFTCLLCNREGLQKNDFLRHFLYHHKFSVKSLSNMVNGKDLGFSVLGANISTFAQSADSEQVLSGETNTDYITQSANIEEDNYPYHDALIPEIKQEIVSDEEGIENEENKQYLSDGKVDQDYDVEQTSDYLSENFLHKWSGREDFDASFVQFLIITKNETDYVRTNFSNMNSSIVTSNNVLNYADDFTTLNISCPLCIPTKILTSLSEFMDHIRQHTFKYNSHYVCRSCMFNCSSLDEIVRHNELKKESFENLFLCQLCDAEFSTREAARSHLSVHWDNLNSVECTSPQLGLKCHYCPLLFWHETERENHHCEVHYNSYKEHFFKCSTCQMIFSDKVWWASHEVLQHSGDENPVEEFGGVWIAFKCVECCKVYRHVDALRKHFLDDHPMARRLYCTMPGCISHPFKVPRYLKRHHEVVHRSGGGSSLGLTNLRCMDCGKQMRTARAAATHRTVAHGDKSASRFKCRICGLGLPSIQDRKLHYLVVHPDVPAFSCTVCGKGYNNKSALYSHRAQSHAINVVTYTCSYCNKNFNKRDSYKEHLLIHVGPRHACPHCSRVFVQRSNMLRHIRLHTGEKPYPCLHCEKTFSDKGACNSHMRTHSKQDAYPCTFCGQKFLQKQKLKYHMRKHTGEDLETCMICAKKFTNHTNLREHMKTHDEAIPVPCLHCGKIFTSKRYMDRHIRDSHSNTAEVHPCPLCGRACPRLTSLRQHLLTHSTVKHITCLICGKSYNGKKSVNRHLGKRHKIQTTDEDYKRSFLQMDPRQCGLGLDEETLERVFGPPKDIKPVLPFQVSNVGSLKLKIKTQHTREPVQRNDDDSSDGEYKPFQKIKVETTDQSTNDGDVPLSGLELASLKSRVRRETTKHVNYALDSDDEDTNQKVFGKSSKKKGKVKYKKKYKTKDVRTNSHNETLEEQPSEEQMPLFTLVNIKCEPVDC